MKGFIDPITLGFIVALIGTATALALDTAEDKSTVASNASHVHAAMEKTADRHDG
jgi:hypothetical protein